MILLLFFLVRVIQHLKYSSLVLVNSTGADTGEYICYPMYCEDSDCRREYDRAAKTFIFFSGKALLSSQAYSFQRYRRVFVLFAPLSLWRIRESLKATINLVISEPMKT